MSDWQHEDDLRALARAEAPDAAEVAALHARLRQSPRRRTPGVRLPVALALGAAAALGVVALRLAPRRLDRALVAEVEPVHEPLGAAVAVTYEGRGAVAGVARDLEITWEAGRLRTDVAPGRGVALRVVTPEATVTVVGTAFTVDRDQRGTTVAVERGTVDLACRGEPRRALEAGLDRVCFRSAAAALQQARETADPAVALEVLDRGLALGAEGPVAVELGLSRVERLQALGRTEEALQEAERLLEGGAAHRQAELRAQAARLAWDQGGCARALPHLREVDPRQVGPTPLVLLGDCLAPMAPGQARDAWQRALAVATGADRARIEARLAQEADRDDGVASPGVEEEEP